MYFGAKTNVTLTARRAAGTRYVFVPVYTGRISGFSITNVFFCFFFVRYFFRNVKLVIAVGSVMRTDLVMFLSFDCYVKSENNRVFIKDQYWIGQIPILTSEMKYSFVRVYRSFQQHLDCQLKSGFIR